MLWSFNAFMLWNFYFDLTESIKIQKLTVNVYFGNNADMAILLKTVLNASLLRVCLIIKVKSCSSLKKIFMLEIKVFMNELQL